MKNLIELIKCLTVLVALVCCYAFLHNATLLIAEFVKNNQPECSSPTYSAENSSQLAKLTKQ